MSPVGLKRFRVSRGCFRAGVTYMKQWDIGRAGSALNCDLKRSYETG